ncbi:hypothetical protein B0T16DRAFT_380978, partial [Cercophora newfieldiana]
MWSPIGALATNQTAEWHDEPLRRGTLSIVFSCLATLVLCSWAVIHLNIPSRKTQLSHRYGWDKLYWFVMAIAAPDKRRCVPNVFLAQDIERPAHQATDQRKHCWTQTHTYYAIMGGFQFEDRRKLHPYTRQLTLTPSGVLFLASDHHTRTRYLPDISQQEILDRSKTNMVAMTIACLQLGWFVLQVASRLSYGLPIALLELNTLAHVIYAIVMYACWWNKPLDVSIVTSIPIVDNSLASLCAAMIMRSRIGFLKALHDSGSGETTTTKLQGILEFSDDEPKSPAEDGPTVDNATDRDADGHSQESPRILPRHPFANSHPSPPHQREKPTLRSRPIPEKEPKSQHADHQPRRRHHADTRRHGHDHFSLAPEEQSHGLIFRYVTKQPNDLVDFINRWQTDRDDTFLSLGLKSAPPTLRMHIDSATAHICRLATTARKDFPELRRSLIQVKQQGLFIEAMLEDEMVAEGEPNNTIRTSGEVWVAMLSEVLGEIFFGAFHLLAWNGPFPTHAENLLWRAASLFSLFGLVIVLALFLAVIALGTSVLVGRVLLKAVDSL